MFIGHLGMALAGKSLAPRTSMGMMFLASEALDFIWPVLVLAGVEHVRITPGITRLTPLDFYDYPISHSLLMACMWGALLALGYWMARRYTRGALVVGVLTVSHWFLDALVHRPDLPLLPLNNHLIGLGLWNHIRSAIALELLIFVVGVALYVSQTTAIDRTGNVALWLLIALLLLIWTGNLFGPPPPSVKAIGIAGVGGGIAFVVWATWVDAHRRSRGASEDDFHLFTEKRDRI